MKLKNKAFKLLYQVEDLLTRKSSKDNDSQLLFVSIVINLNVGNFTSRDISGNLSFFLFGFLQVIAETSYKIYIYIYIFCMRFLLLLEETQTKKMINFLRYPWT
eukprot:TRINITY_DN4286_c0_g2_i1.p2 TRINITY_DN4286_c0_g2~~TRINITY_DN4286_c0_g2_i1.p2  ORF type:complete len:104 (-),score=3.40 TRINITY_DN4286_c0_g2_i1:601-912(-)